MFVIQINEIFKADHSGSARESLRTQLATGRECRHRGVGTAVICALLSCVWAAGCCRSSPPLSLSIHCLPSLAEWNRSVLGECQAPRPRLDPLRNALPMKLMTRATPRLRQHLQVLRKVGDQTAHVIFLQDLHCVSRGRAVAWCEGH